MKHFSSRFSKFSGGLIVAFLAFLLTSTAFAWNAPAWAWQDPCSAMEYTYEFDGYTLGDWEPATSMFSPAPECEGTVNLYAPDGSCVPLHYVARGDYLMIANVPCRVRGNGDLVCKVVTQPEVSYNLIFDQRVME